MKIREITVLCAALAAGATLSAHSTSNQVLVAPNDGQRAPTLAARPLEGRVVKGAPYSAEIASDSVQMLADGNRIVHSSTGRVYRDRDGRTRREDDRPNGTASVSITDPVAGKSWTLDTAAKTARETPAVGLATSGFFITPIIGEIEGRVTGNVLVDRRAGTATAPTIAGGVARGGGAGAVAATGERGGAVGATGGVSRGGGGGRGGRGAGETLARVEEQLPSRSIEGVVCSGVRRTTTIPAGSIGNEQPIKIVSEEWTSMDLQVLVQTDLNDPRTGHATYQLSRISRADPDPGLFKVPSDFTLVGGGGRGRGGK